jgi:hypothetical protein
MRYFLVSIFLTVSLQMLAQLTDDFSDNNFTSLPSWSGDDSVFTVLDVSGNKRLRSNKLIANSSYYLSTPSITSNEGQWEFFVNLQFNTSSANYVDFYLMADNQNLLNTSLSGYFVRIGGTTDEISLYKKVSGTNTKIIDGVDGITNFSPNQLKIKVTKTISGDWKLERDNTGTGNAYVQEGIINDLTINTSLYFGISITQSTASFFQKHFFDDIYVGPIILDITPPQMVSVTPVGPQAVDVLFNEPLEITSAQSLLNYVFNPVLTVQPPQLDANNPSLVHLFIWPPGMSNGTTYQLTTSSISDISGNISGNQTLNFTYLVAETPIPGDVFINEFMCDPSPTVGLPEVEYIEVYNKSNKYFDLTGWKIGDASSDGTIQEGWLYPGEHRILCASSNVDTFTMTQAYAVTSFPSLNNAGDDIVLKDLNGIELDRISYTDNWYKDEVKAEGGYSIERINPNDPCSAEDNWMASNSISGGTPGSINSVFDDTPDTTPPVISELIALAPNYLEVHFSEGMDSTLLTSANYIVDPFLNLQSVYVFGSHPDMVTLQYTDNFEPSKTYQFFIENAADCWMNPANLNGYFTLPDIAEKGDVFVNEILFDPYTNGYDWIELVNTSSKVIDLQGWQLANYDDTITNFKTVNNHFYIKPGGFAVLGKDSVFVKQSYPFYGVGTFVYCETPSFNVDSSTVYLIYDNQVMDAVSYSSEWHFPLLDDTDGVSLERVDTQRPSSDPTNWHSAAEPIGFATPGLENSQYYPASQSGDFDYESATFSPDNDGYEDLLLINYSLIEPSLLGRFTIYDDRGRLIKTVFDQELLGTKGVFSWDGITDENVKARIGTYVGVFEAFSINGGVSFTKTKAFVVSGKL